MCYPPGMATPPAPDGSFAITVAANGDTPNMSPQSPGEPPRDIGAYQLGRRLGVGGMGAVYLATSPEGVEVALKVMRPELAAAGDFAERFRREAAVMAEVRHPNVVAALGSGQDRGWLWLALEFLPDGDLEQYLKRRGQLMEKDAVGMAVQCARGLAACHERGLVHRDFKPANVFLAIRRGTEGGAIDAKVGDLGLARHESGDDRMTMTGTACGTPAYMAPEQVRGEADLDARVDVYALGATLYRLVTGQDPFSGQTIYMLTNAVLKEPVPDPRKFNPTISAALVGIILKAMSKDRKDRFATVADMAIDLERVALGKNLHHAAAVPSPASIIFQEVAGASAPKGISLGLGRGGGNWFSDIAWKPIIRLAIPAALGCAALWGLSSMLDGKTESKAAAATAAAAATKFELAEDSKGKLLRTPLGQRTLVWRWCPPGSGQLGSPAGRAFEPLRGLRLTSGFWMLDSEVDAGLWASVVADPVQPAQPTLPAVGHDRDAAEHFCTLLGQRLGGLTLRLPTEAEWEWAARAGADTEEAAGPQDRWATHTRVLAAWTGQESAVELPMTVEDAWRYDRDDSSLAARPVGGGLANGWGLHDMVGNVQEWCADRWDGVSPGDPEAVDPRGRVGSLAAVRGGSWIHPRFLCRSGARFAGRPGGAQPWIGLRPIIPAPAGPSTVPGQ